MFPWAVGSTRAIDLANLAYVNRALSRKDSQNTLRQISALGIDPSGVRGALLKKYSGQLVTWMADCPVSQYV